MKWLTGLFFNVCTVCRGSKSPTVRYAFPLTFMAVALLGAQAIMSQSGTSIIVESSTNSLKAGESFYLDIYVNTDKEINAVDLELTFPKDRMRVTGIDKGESVITLWTVEPYVEDNAVYLRGGTFRRGFKGQHLIATVNAVAKESGIATVNITDFMLLAGDGAGTQVPADDSAGTAKIYIANQDGSYSGLSKEEEDEAKSITSKIKIEITTDIDGDGDVSLADVSRFMSAWFNGDTVFDFNGDGRMTFRDFGIILSDSFFK